MCDSDTDLDLVVKRFWRRVDAVQKVSRMATTPLSCRLFGPTNGNVLKELRDNKRSTSIKRLNRALRNLRQLEEPLIADGKLSPVMEIEANSS